MFNSKVVAAGLSAVFLVAGTASANVVNPQVERAGNFDRSAVEGTIPVDNINEVPNGHPVSLRGVFVSKPDGVLKLKDETGSVTVDLAQNRWTGYLDEPGVPFDVSGVVERNTPNHRPVVVARTVSVYEDK